MDREKLTIPAIIAVICIILIPSIFFFYESVTSYELKNVTNNIFEVKYISEEQTSTRAYILVTFSDGSNLRLHGFTDTVYSKLKPFEGRNVTITYKEYYKDCVFDSVVGSDAIG